MSTNQAETASAQSTLEKVRELQKLEQWATVGPWIMNDLSPRQYRVGSNSTGKTLADMRYTNGCHDGRFIASVRNAFPEIASLVESQAKRITELERLLQKSLVKMRVMHKQTGGEYGGGPPLELLTAAIENILPPSPSHE